MSIIEATARSCSANGYTGRRVSSDEELLRASVEEWGRSRWPGARVCHELVVGRGKNRADLAFIGTDHFVTVEIKSRYDTTDRLINQVSMFRLCSPETWIIADQRHDKDSGLVKFLLPSIGVALSAQRHVQGQLPTRDVTIIADPTPFVADPEALLSLLWVAELRQACVASRLGVTPRDSHASLVRQLLRLSYADQVKVVCRALRARDAVWRADPPIAEDNA